MKNILDQTYVEWSNQQKLAKRDDSSESFQRARAIALAEQKRANDDARARRLQAEREANQAKADERLAKVNASLEPQKRRLRNEWLASRPGSTMTDFEQQAWPHLRENLIDEQQNAALTNEVAAIANTSRYSL